MAKNGRFYLKWRLIFVFSEIKELKQKKKQMQQQLKYEDQLVSAAKRWTDEILPNWETMYDNRTTSPSSISV